MTETREVSIEDVRLLVAERQRYDDWMSALEAKRSETPARVFDRVYGDYAERRAGVMARLREHVDTLASLGRDLESKLGELESRLASLEDERAEAMLRTAVGEFDDSKWEEIRRNVEASIAEGSDERELLLMEVDDVRTLLASASSEPPRAPTSAPATASEESLIDLAEETRAETDAAESATASHPDDLLVDDHAEDRADERADDRADDDARIAAALERAPEAIVITESLETITPVDAFAAAGALEIDDALVVFSPDEPIAPSPHVAPVGSQAPADAPAAAPLNAAPTAAPPSVDSFDDLAFLRSVIDPPGASPMSSANASSGSASAGAGAATTAYGDSGVRVEAAGSPQKTLRCTECGTMNLPTEWYCERCGGELAAF